LRAPAGHYATAENEVTAKSDHEFVIGDAGSSSARLKMLGLGPDIDERH
jgi:hypothetical protein